MFHEDYSTALSMGRSKDANFKEVLRLLNNAADCGDDRAKYALATWYLYGNAVVERNEQKGVKILKGLVDSMIAEAVFDLAVAYDYGRSVRKNSSKAFSLYMSAALLGDKSACEQISQFYGEGKLVPFNPLLRDVWQRRSEENEESISPPYRIRLTKLELQ